MKSKKLLFVILLIFMLTLILNLGVYATNVPVPTEPYTYPYWIIYEDQYGLKMIESKYPIKVGLKNGNLDSWRISAPRFGWRVANWEIYNENTTDLGYPDYKVSNAAGATILYANHDILVYNNDTVFFGRHVELEANVNIVLPCDGFMDNSPIFVFWTNTNINKRLNNEEIKKLKINIFIDGERPSELGYYINVNDNKMYHYDNYTENSLRFEIDIPYGEHYIEVVYEYEGDEIGRDGVMVERLVGFIDDDGDGLDDRTGQPYVPEKPVDPTTDIDKPVKPSEDGNVIDWLKYLGEYIGYIFEILISSISNFAKNVVSGVGSVLSLAEPMFNFVNQFFSSMPVEIRTAIMAMFSVSVFLVIMKMIRG